jgi:hypothetical protein
MLAAQKATVGLATGGKPYQRDRRCRNGTGSLTDARRVGHRGVEQTTAAFLHAVAGLL